MVVLNRYTVTARVSVVVYTFYTHRQPSIASRARPMQSPSRRARNVARSVRVRAIAAPLGFPRANLIAGVVHGEHGGAERESRERVAPRFIQQRMRAPRVSARERVRRRRRHDAQRNLVVRASAAGRASRRARSCVAVCRWCAVSFGCSR